ncbi:MAG: PDZ domain-containing protein [Acidobacteriota bacterium]|nr:PDZ domain-containing protein [Acidobacteriota bacterium]
MSLRILFVSCWIFALLASASAQTVRRKAQTPRTGQVQPSTQSPGDKPGTPALRQNDPIGWAWVTQTIDLSQQFGSEENIFTLDGEPPPSLQQKRVALGLIIDDKGHVITRLVDVTPSNPPTDLTVRVSGRGPTKARFVGMDTVTGFCVIKIDELSLRPGEPLPTPANTDTTSVLLPKLSIRLVGFHPNQSLRPAGQATMTITPRLNSFQGSIAKAINDFRYNANNPIYYLQTPQITAMQDGSLIYAKDSLFGVVLYNTGREGSHIVYPISRVLAIAESVIKSNQSIAYGWLGANGQNYSPALPTQTSRTPGESGVIITTIAPDSPADLAGVKTKDILLSVNERRVETRDQLASALRQIPADSEISLRVRRGAEYKMFKAKLVPAPSTEPEQQIFSFVRRLEAMKAELKAIPAGDPKRQNLEARYSMMSSFVQSVSSPAPPDIRLRVFYGLEVQSMTGQLMTYFAVTNGLLVSCVSDKNKAALGGLKPGDVIVKVGDQQINSLLSLVNGLDNAQGDTIEITVSRRRETVKLSLPR